MPVGQYGSVEPFPIRRTRLLSRPIQYLDGACAVGSDRPVCQDCAFVQSIRQESFMGKQTTPLRQRMIEDMTIRNMSPSSKKIYVRAVANFSIYHGRSPDKLSAED